jgi:hypothetical protein
VLVPSRFGCGGDEDRPSTARRQPRTLAPICRVPASERSAAAWNVTTERPWTPAATSRSRSRTSWPRMVAGAPPGGTTTEPPAFSSGEPPGEHCEHGFQRRQRHRRPGRSGRSGRSAHGGDPRRSAGEGRPGRVGSRRSGLSPTTTPRSRPRPKGTRRTRPKASAPSSLRGTWRSAQLTRAAGAGAVHGVASNDAKADYARKHGYDEVSRPDAFDMDVRRATGGRGVDLVPDPVGGDTLRRGRGTGRLRAPGVLRQRRRCRTLAGRAG